MLPVFSQDEKTELWGQTNKQKKCCLKTKVIENGLSRTTGLFGPQQKGELLFLCAPMLTTISSGTTAACWLFSSSLMSLLPLLKPQPPTVWLFGHQTENMPLPPSAWHIQLKAWRNYSGYCRWTHHCRDGSWSVCLAALPVGPRSHQWKAVLQFDGSEMLARSTD